MSGEGNRTERRGDVRDDGVVLVTGGTGVVGCALLDELADGPLAALIHSTPLAERQGTVEAVRGNLTAPSLGLPRERYADLAGRCRAVVHCAANTDFAAAPGTISRLNVGGVNRILEFAVDAGGIPVYYVSTAFVARAGLLPKGRENGFGCSAGRDEYLASKQEAEQIVRDSGLPVAIVRPSVLIGDSRSGEILRFQGLHTFLGALCKGALPFIPFSEETLVDFVPQDVVAQAIAALVRSEQAAGEYWITAGEGSLTAASIVSTALEIMLEHGREIVRPRFLETEMVERLILPAFIDVFPEREQRLFENFLALATLFSTPTPFESDIAAIPAAPDAPTQDFLRGVLDRTVRRHWTPQRKLTEVSA